MTVKALVATSVAAIALVVSNPTCADEWKADVQGALEQALSAQFHDISIQYHNTESVNQWMQSCSDYTLDIGRALQLRASRVAVKATCHSQRMRPVFIQAEVDGAVTYWVATRDLKARQQVSATDFIQQTGSWSELPPNALLTKGADEELFNNAVVRRSISKNSVLLDNALQRPYAVNYGDQVTLRYEGAGFTVEQQVKALGRGHTGDTIYVQLSNRKRLEARVVENGVLKASK